VNLMPLYMSTIAGMSTCLGAAWVLCQRRPQPRYRRNSNSSAPPPEPIIKPSTMCFSLALAGSVMVTVSVVSIIPECLRDEDSNQDSYHMIPLWSMTFVHRMVSHLAGYILYFLLAKFAFPEPEEILGLSVETTGTEDNDLLVDESCHKKETTPVINIVINKEQIQQSPSRTTLIRRMEKGVEVSSSTEEFTNTSEAATTPKQKPSFLRSFSRYSSGSDLETPESKRAWRVAMLLWLSLTVHNFPEGLAVAASAMDSPQLGLKVTIGIMIHNIPEGISIAVPCLAARPDMPCLAFWLSALSGLAEPFGAFVALFVLRDIDKHSQSSIYNMENVLAFVAGIMIMVAAAELFPEALRHTKQGMFHFVSGTIAGILLMTATELYLQ
jgi:zinc transporter, ZIP family